jgi:hypothetical protein
MEEGRAKSSLGYFSIAASRFPVRIIVVVAIVVDSFAFRRYFAIKSLASVVILVIRSSFFPLSSSLLAVRSWH